MWFKLVIWKATFNCRFYLGPNLRQLGPYFYMICISCGCWNWTMLQWTHELYDINTQYEVDFICGLLCSLSNLWNHPIQPNLFWATGWKYNKSRTFWLNWNVDWPKIRQLNLGFTWFICIYLFNNIYYFVNVKL